MVRGGRFLQNKYIRDRECSGLLNCVCGCHYEAEFRIWENFKDVVEGNVRGSGSFYLPTWLKLEFPYFHSPNPCQVYRNVQRGVNESGSH